MSANSSIQEKDLVDAAVAWLAERVPRGWIVNRSETMYGGAAGAPARQLDGAIDLVASNGMRTTILVEAKAKLTPRDADRFLVGIPDALRTVAANIPIMVVSQWLSPRTQDVLTSRDVSFLDLTGNALIRTDNPAVYIRSQGESRDPRPSARGRAGVRGPKAARVVRLLVDVRPPYRVTDIVAATGLAAGYVSRLLDALDEEALIERVKRGEVQSVDIAGLLRRWAESYDVLTSNEAFTFVAPDGAAPQLERLASPGTTRRAAITGSFAAARLAPVAAPALLLAYCDDPSTVGKTLGLLPAVEGSNVALLRPYDSAVWERTVQESGIEYVAPSQTVVDCLTGTGRMPAEGEAVLAWMLEDESRWRLPSIDRLPSPKATA